MPAFYCFSVIVGLSCSTSVLVTALFLFLTRKRKFETLVPVLGVLQLTFIVALILINMIGYRLQVAVALPYIQEALNTDCPYAQMVAIADGFYKEDFFRWKSDDESANCRFTDRWHCDCSP